jgi:hypothetical protein
VASKQSPCAPGEPPDERSATSSGNPKDDGSHVVWIGLRRGYHGWFARRRSGDVKPPEPVPKAMVRQMELFVNDKEDRQGEAA